MALLGKKATLMVVDDPPAPRRARLTVWYPDKPITGFWYKELPAVVWAQQFYEYGCGDVATVEYQRCL